MADTRHDRIIKYLVDQHGLSASQAEHVWDSLPAGDRENAFTPEGGIKRKVDELVKGSAPAAAPVPVTAEQQAAIAGMAGALHGQTAAQVQAAITPTITMSQIQAMSADDLFNWMTTGRQLVNVEDEPLFRSRPGSDYQTGTAAQGFHTPTVKDQLVAMARLGRDDLMRLQQKLKEGGYYSSESKVQWGYMDMATQNAVQNLVTDAMFHRDLSIDELTAQAGERNLTDLVTSRRQSVDEKAQALLTSQGITSATTLTASDDLIVAGQRAAEAAIGRRLTPQENADFIAHFHAGEQTDAQGRYDKALAKAKEGAQGVSDQQVDQFLAAVSTGDGSGRFLRATGANEFGMDAATWARYADKVGIPGALQTPENVRLVGREIALTLYSQYGNWQDVARAWFAGPGSNSAWQPGGADAQRDSSLQGFLRSVDTSIDGRADVVTRAMRSQTFGVDAAGSTAAGTSSSALTYTEGTPSPSAAAEMWLQTNKPQEYVGHAAAERASDFFSFIGQPGANLQGQN